ncbi:MAG: hypothetical protein HY088_00760 [Ignavibacteriales bacterium]|nr:hypothetical protein [Ignavibacteriales bacterium]
MKSLTLILIIVVSCAGAYAQNSPKAVQAVTFAVNSSHYSSFVGSKSLTIPFSNATSNTTSLVFNSDAKASKKITVALNSSLPNGVALRLNVMQQNADAPVQKIISATPSEIVVRSFYNAGESLRKIQLQYSATKTGVAVPSTDQTVIYTITD